jgi:hypothetical protein
MAIVLIENDYPLTWAETQTWAQFSIMDSWAQGYRFPAAEFTLTATGQDVQEASAELSCTFSQSTKGGLLVQVNELYVYDWDSLPNWASFQNDQWGPTGFFAFEQISLSASGEIEPKSSASLLSEFLLEANPGIVSNAVSNLSANFDQQVVARIIKFADLDIQSFASLTVSGDVTSNNIIILESQFTQVAKGGLLVEVNELYVYDWDSLPNWASFQNDQWGPRGFFAFEQISLSASGGITTEAASALSSQFTLSVIGGYVLSGTADLSAQFNLTSGSDVFKNAESSLASAFDIDTRAVLTANASAVLQDAFNFELLADKLVRGTVTLSVETDLAVTAVSTLSGIATLETVSTLTANAGTIFDGVSNLSSVFDISVVGLSNEPVSGAAALESAITLVSQSDVVRNFQSDLNSAFTVSVSAVNTLNGRANLNVDGFVLADGISVAPVLGTAGLNVIANLIVDADMTLNGRANLNVDGFVLADGISVAPVTGSANFTVVNTLNVKGSIIATGKADLSMQGFLISEGQFPLPTSKFIVKVLSETRTFSVYGETRQQPVLPENRTLKIE